jgi:hypothetical protein
VISNFSNKNISCSENNLYYSKISVSKLTALWAFSESALGGILHALTIPFRGLFISGAAVLFISLIALFSKSSKDILKSTLIVIFIKALISPHTPLTAYFAVCLQGLLGYLLFYSKHFYRASALLLGILALFFSGMQKLVLLTVLFGETLWRSTDFFIIQVANEFFKLGIQNDTHFSYLLIGIYVSIHLLAGVFIGFYAGRLPQKIKYYYSQIPKIILDDYENDTLFENKKRKKKSWLFRPSGIILIIASIIVLIFSYIFPAKTNIAAVEILIMLIRSIVLTFIWYSLLVPILKKIFQKYSLNKRTIYIKEIDEVIKLFPQFRKVVSYCWNESITKKGIKRIQYFLSTSFYFLLIT